MNWQEIGVILLVTFAFWQLIRIFMPSRRKSKKACGSTGAGCGCGDDTKPVRFLGFKIDKRKHA